MSSTVAARAMQQGTFPAASPQRFRLFHALILVAACAPGFGIAQSICRQEKDSPSDLFQAVFLDWSQQSLFDYASKPLDLATLVMPMVAMISLALIPIRLCEPRPDWRRLGRRPGLLAGCAAGLALAVVCLPNLVAWAVQGRQFKSFIIDESILQESTTLGSLAVLGSWLPLWVGRQRHIKPDGIDRLGQVMGISWIIAGFGVWMALFLSDWMCVCHFTARSIVSVSLTPIELIGQKVLTLSRLATPILVVATLGLIAIVLIGPRPRDRRLKNRPGRLAVCAAGLVLILPSLAWLFGLFLAAITASNDTDWKGDIEGWIAGAIVDPELWFNAFFDYADGFGAKSPGVVVAASWMLALIGRRWRAESTWVDRLGRALGIGWIVAGLAVVAGEILLRR